MEDENQIEPAVSGGKRKKLGGTGFKRALVYFYLLMGILYFVISNYFNIEKMLR